MKIFLRDKFLVTWFLCFELAALSNTFFVSGMEASFKTHTDNFQDINKGKNISSHENVFKSPSRFDIETEKPKTLKEYLHKLPTTNKNHKLTSFPAANNLDSTVVEVANTSYYEKESKGLGWEKVAEPRAETFPNQSIKYENKNHNFENDFDSTLEEDDEILKYIRDQKDLLYTFKDFVNIGSNPSLKEKLADIKSSNEQTMKTFDVTYVMPIPKTRKYFEIKMSNLTETQYNEINSLLQDHMRNKTQKQTEMKNKDDEIVYVDIEENKKYVTSRDLIQSSSLPDPTLQSTQTQNNSVNKNWPRSPEEVLSYFETMFSEDAHKFKNVKQNFTSNEERSASHTGKFVSSITPPIIKNNGFHAEIATDYIHRNSSQRNKNAPLFSGDQNIQLNNQDSVKPSVRNNPTSDFDERSVATATSILSSVYKKRNITKLTQLPSSGKPIGFYANSSLNRSIRTRTEGSLGVTGFSTASPITQYNLSALEPIVMPTPTEEKITKNAESFQEATHNIGLFQTILPNMNEALHGKENTTSTPSEQDWTDLLKLYGNENIDTNLPIGLSNLSSHQTQNITLSETTNKFDDLDLMNLMQAAKWIFDMKKQMQEERKKENERYMSYIKKYLAENDGSLSRGEGGDTNVMKIKKQDNILEELKLLMVRYFAAMNFKSEEDVNNSNFPEVESMLNSSNIFELMDSSSQLVKLNLQKNIQTVTNEPRGFLKGIVERQVETCNHIFNRSLQAKSRKSPEYLKKNGHRRFLVFTKCMNLKMKRCIKGFTMWLEKGKFYLRAQFNLVRAYENYEIERNLYCLRTYSPTSLDSNLHGVRMRPGPKINRKPGSRKVKSRQSKTRFRMRKMKSGEHAGKVGRRNMARNRKTMNQQDIFQTKIMKKTAATDGLESSRNQTQNLLWNEKMN